MFSTAMLRVDNPYSLGVRYAPETLVPCCAVDGRWFRLRPVTEGDWSVFDSAEFLTTDRRLVRMRVLCAWNDTDGGYDGELDDLCDRLYGMSFKRILSVWRSRYPKMDGYWYLVRLDPVGGGVC